MIKEIKLDIEVDVPNENGIIYRKEIMESMVDRLNQPKYIPIVVCVNPDEYNNPPIGRVIPKTSIFDGRNIQVNIDVEDYIIDMIDSNKYIIATYMLASVNENNEVVLRKNFNIIELQIIRNREVK